MTSPILFIAAWSVGRFVARRPRPIPEQVSRGFGWQGLAIACACILTPVVITGAVMRSSAPMLLLAALLSFAWIGILGFAFGRQWGSPRFWVNFAVFFSIVAAFCMGPPLARLTALLIRIRTMSSFAEVPVLAGFICLPPVMSWALLRYGGLFAPQDTYGRDLDRVFR